MEKEFVAEPISARTKGELNQLRKSGYIPVSIQRKGEETRHFQHDSRLLEDFIRKHGASALLEMALSPDNKKEAVLVHDIQRHPVTHRLLQVTFQRVLRNEKIKTLVQVVLTGVAEEVKDGTSVLQHPTEQVEVQCLPRNLPGHIAVDISIVTHTRPLRVSDIPPSNLYEILTPGDAVLAALTAKPSAASEEAAEAADTDVAATAEATSPAEGAE